MSLDSRTSDNPMAAQHEPTSAGPVDAAVVEEAMRDVIDPELGINVVDSSTRSQMSTT